MSDDVVRFQFVEGRKEHGGLSLYVRADNEYIGCVMKDEDTGENVFLHFNDPCGGGMGYGLTQGMLHDVAALLHRIGDSDISKSFE